MPSQSKAQHNFMEMIKHGGKPRSGHGPSKAVASEFVAADKGKSMKRLPRHKGKGHRMTAGDQARALRKG